MSNYLYFQHEQQPLSNRFNVEYEISEGYRINGLEDWQELISLLLYWLAIEPIDQNLEERQNIRRRVLGMLIDIISTEDNINDYNPDPVFEDSRSTEELIVIVLLARLRRKYRPLSCNRCQRLFISHRKMDKQYALRMAKLAYSNGFAYWLDVLNPDLQSLSGTTHDKQLIPLLTACIIEMALINCTHVLACMTPNTIGTLWVPYEYGRIKHLPLYAANVAAWLHPNLDAQEFPEYMWLGKDSFK